MRYSTSLWDWLFGERITIELPNGQSRNVTKAWFAEMQRHGQIRPAKSVATTVRVHCVGRTPDFDGDVHKLDEWLASGSKTYTIEEWEVGVDVPPEQVEKWMDPQTGELHVVYKIVDGTWRFACCTRKVWQKFKAVEDAK